MSTLLEADAELGRERVSSLIDELLQGLPTQDALHVLDLARARLQPPELTLVDPFRTLSEREQQVAQLVMEGLKSQQIADRLTISIKTVDTHRTRVFKKLGIHSVVDLIRVAAAHKRFP
jgi:DNA-binding NarL/FixJ family response regulator